MAKRSIQELSAQTKYDAGIKAAIKGFDRSNYNDMERKKAAQQGDALLKHVDPETVKKVEAFAKQLDLDYTIKKDPNNPNFESIIVIELGKNLKNPNLVQSAPIKVYISKDRSEVDGVLPDQAAERKLGMLIKYIQQKELGVNLIKADQALWESKRKLNFLIDKIIKEELSAHNKLKEQNQRVVFTTDGTSRTLTPNQREELKKARPGDSTIVQKAGTSMKEGDVEQDSIKDQPAPSAADIAGKMSEILDKLNNMSEMKQDPKYKKHAEKAAKYMEAAKSALEGLTNYETMLEEKDKENKEKGAGKVLKTIEKALSKIIKDKNMVAKIMHKMPVSKVIELQSTANKELDEEKVAKAMLNVALKEGYINSNK